MQQWKRQRMFFQKEFNRLREDRERGKTKKGLKKRPYLLLSKRGIVVKRQNEKETGVKIGFDLFFLFFALFFGTESH